MWRWNTPLVSLAALVLAAGAGCSREMSDREYCTRRQMAWEMAFPNLTVSDGDRTRFVESCASHVARAPADERDRSRRCMVEHLKGRGHAHEQYVAFTRCEVVDPSRPR